MDIGIQYQILYKQSSVIDYNVPVQDVKKEDKFSQNRSNRKQPKRETFVADIERKSKQTPGAGNYFKIQKSKSQPKKVKKIDFEAEQKKGVHNYLDDLIKVKNKMPAVGKYEIEKDHTEETKLKYKAQNDRMRKDAPLFRPTIFDESNRDAINVAPGIYQPDKPLGYQNTRGAFQPMHKKSKSLAKLPSVHEYSPVPVAFQTFEKKMSVCLDSTTSAKSHGFGIGKRSSFKGSTLGPGPTYSLICKWAPEGPKNNPEKPINIIRTSKDLTMPSIYH